MQEVQRGDDSRVVVALFELDPKTIDWPYSDSQPLPLTMGQEVKTLLDEGGEWAFGCLRGHSEIEGWYPKNYTVSPAEYEQLVQDDQGIETDPQVLSEELLEPDEPPPGPPKTAAIQPGPLPPAGTRAATFGSAAGVGPLDDDLFSSGARELPEDVIPGIAHHPPLDPRPPHATTFDQTRSQLLNDPPRVPSPAPDTPDRAEDPIMRAMEEVALEKELADQLDPQALAGGRITESRASTPATYNMTRPDFDFVGKQPKHAPIDPQGANHKPLSKLVDVMKKKFTIGQEVRNPYTLDIRVRATTMRLATGITPYIMQKALERSKSSGARWTQMFRPGFNDIVNESFKVGCNACILSEQYLANHKQREMFQKHHTKDVKGTLWFELQRRKDHLFYMRMDFVDVMMCHPDAWGFPDTSKKVVAKNPGEPINPFHGWYAQTAIDTDKEMEDVDFLYTLRVREFPEHTFQALALGKIPEWIQPYTTLHAEAQREDIKEEDTEDGVAGPVTGKEIDLEHNQMLEAGLGDGDNLYVKLDGDRLAQERTTGPDVLDAKTTAYRLKGLSAMRIFLRSRGNPDNMKQALITPKMVKDMASQLGIRGDAAHYWYCLFALRYPLAHDWEAVVKNDTRWYLHLPSDKLQPVHPKIKLFREHLADVMKNEFLWDHRDRVHHKCSQCGIPDAVVWCMQCTDYFCCACFLEEHKSQRGKKHWPMPVPGCRYLYESEVTAIQPHIPFLNVGFSNRRRFLARTNQSDKLGSTRGDTWLFFDADTFEAALKQAPKDHWCVKRTEPPRLASDAKGYYYNFDNDVIADDDSYILTKAMEQKALSILQKVVRGNLTRKQIKREMEAAVVIQKTKHMWDVREVHGNNGKNAAILKSWYRKFKARKDRDLLERRITRNQALWRGLTTRKEFNAQMRSCSRFQSAFRGLRGRRRHLVLKAAALSIQRLFRGYFYGRRPTAERHAAASQMQAMARGCAQRHRNKVRREAATNIQAHGRGMLARNGTKRMQDAANKIQRNWRRFQAQLDVKIRIYENLEEIRQKRKVVLRRKLENAVASIIQRNWRRHLDYQKVVLMRKEKGEAEKHVNSMLVALYISSSQLRHFVHPWWRHLPKEIQEVLQQIKAGMQHTIATTPLTGKLANEELGGRILSTKNTGGPSKPLRVGTAEHLTYKQDGRVPDLASHMLLSVSRHLLSHVPADLFGPAMRWACYTIAHQAVDLKLMQGYLSKQEIPVGKELPKHEGDSLATLWSDVGIIKHHHDWLMTMPEESLPCRFLYGMPLQHRHVFLTAKVLILMRQALKNPSISVNDHLKFQGLDASSGAQLMEVLGSELDKRLPLDWPKKHGTVAALTAQLNTHITDMELEGKTEDTSKRDSPKRAARPKRRSTARLEVQDDKAKPKQAKKTEEPDKEDKVELPEGGALSHFNRNATLRVVQQISYLMRDQDKLLNAVLSRSDEAGVTKGQGIRQSRIICVTDKLFDMASRAEHPHCEFCLAVVLYHMVLRALFVRVLYHRAAIAIQMRYRYVKQRGKKMDSIAPAICIQRCWRGLCAALRIMRKDNAAEKIQNSYKAWHWNRRAAILLRSTLLIQRVWRGAIHRKWMHECHFSATVIQKHVRGLLVRVVMDRAGQEILRSSKAEMAQLVQKKPHMAESLYIAKTAAVAGKMRSSLQKIRDRNVDLKRMSFSLRSKHTRHLDKQRKLQQRGAIQPARVSIFEPMVFALARLEPCRKPRYGAAKSRVLMKVNAARRLLDRLIPREQVRKPHACAVRGCAAVAARRLARWPKTAQSTETKSGNGFVDSVQLDKWMSSQFGPRL